MKIQLNEKSISARKKLTEGDVAFQDMGLENKEQLGSSTKPIEIEKADISTMAPKQLNDETMEPIVGDEQYDKIKKDFSIKKMIEIKAPEKYNKTKTTIFLAGSIDMGKAIDWQAKIAKALEDEDVILLNPRRDEWNALWEQSIDNPKFKEQVDWELDNQNKCDIIAMYFSPESKAPITLLELGLFADTGKLIVCVPDGFYRKGNVEIVCKRNNIEMVESFNEFIFAIKKRLNSLYESEDEMLKNFSRSPGAFSTQHQIPGEMSNIISDPKPVDTVEEIKKRTPQRENKEPFYEKSIDGLNPNQDDEIFWSSIDDLLLDDEIIDIQKSHLIGSEQYLPLGAKDLAGNLERDLYLSLRKTVNSWFMDLDETTNVNDALISLKKDLVKWNQDISKDTLIGLHKLIDLGVKAGVRKTKIPVSQKFYNKVNVTSFSEKGLMPAIQRFNNDAFDDISKSIKKHKMASYRMKREIDSELKKMRPRTKLILKTETARFGNLGMLEALNEDPEKYFYAYYWKNPLDSRTKEISKMRAEGNPYSFSEITWLWKNQEQLINNKWQADQYNQRCYISRGKKLDKEWKKDRFTEKELEFHGTF